jgi:dethiobiotin synthetase
MTRAYFITGTDTGVGKTLISCALLHAARAAGLSAVGMKPVAAGAQSLGGRLMNEDVAALMAASSVAAAPELVNPYCLAQAVAPHVAAATEGVRLDARRIRSACEQLAAMAEFVVVEGVGGFRVPLGADWDSADLARDLGLPLLLVVGMRLGCLNHALLTVEAILARGLPLAGWIANRIDPGMLRYEENLAALCERIDAPLLGVVEHRVPPDAAHAAADIRLP